ncbi:polysaccharide lyase family 7 protein [Alcanivorax sp. S6407]|uniref:polysaccharide lyase family 7 protein n=1 Tax=Alcanivorax sp. S6407 TaxID=2926424 RepID=UPI001FF19182|nr:polysaccharide lyase family 7 protein [Alcanivorax sp. S6407]MCK0152140.1 polysaccharide lyase family 7 protein [Alcanivorax sp. S6407]
MCSLYKTLVFIFTLNVIGCGGSDTPSAITEKDTGSSYDTSTEISKETDSGGDSLDTGSETGSTSETEAPVFDLKSFKESFIPSFSASVLQYEVTDGVIGKETTGTDELLKFPETDYFYFKDQYLVYDLTREGKPKKRSELRQYPEWSVANENSMKGTLRLESSPLNEYTWMQLHRKEYYSVKPPLRLTWAKSQSIGGKVYTDYLVAVFYHEDGGYKKVPLMPRPDGDMVAELRAYNHQVFITINDTLLHVENVSDWGDYNCYFKAGLYLSGSTAAEGQARVGMSSLEFNIEG